MFMDSLLHEYFHKCYIIHINKYINFYLCTDTAKPGANRANTTDGSMDSKFDLIYLRKPDTAEERHRWR